LSPRLGLVGLLLLLVGCGPGTPDEEQIRAELRNMAEALAESDVRGVLAPLADDFSGVTWDLDQRAARLLLQRELRAREQLRARIFDIDVEMRGESRAVAEFQVVLTGGSGLIPETGRWYRVQSGWRRDGNDWKMVSAEWEPVAGRR
jgi:ketosteroid isomerase-like protein